MPKVSIIIPCLNCVRYIKETMDSIVNQTLRDIEIIIVDAGSTDGTLEVLQEYALKDTRVKILTSSMKSMGYQYNMGMDAAAGDYIGFVEADDYIERGMYEELYAAMQEHGADYVKSDFDMFADFNDERLFVRYGPLPKDRKDLYGKEISIIDCLELVLRDFNIWNGLYSKDFIEERKIRFNETPGAAFQDMGFVLQTLVLADKAVYTGHSHYRYRRDNINSSVYNKNALNYITWELEYVSKRLASIESEVCSLCKPLIFFRFFNSLSSMLEKRPPNDDYDSEIYERISSFRDLLKDGYEGIDASERSWIPLEQSQELLLFLADFKQYCSKAKLLADINRQLLWDWVKPLKRQPEILLFGAGENGGSVYCYLKRNGITVTGFCDNNQNRWHATYMNKTVYPPSDAAAKYPDAVYITTIAYQYSLDVKSQLAGLGVESRNICNYISLLTPHTAFEHDTFCLEDEDEHI